MAKPRPTPAPADLAEAVRRLAKTERDPGLRAWLLALARGDRGAGKAPRKDNAA